jgi:chloride channel, nucleotide-sensitive, 1A
MFTTIRTPLSLDDFVLLAVHQSQTPETFFGGKPILHYHTKDAKAWLANTDGATLPIFPADLENGTPTGPSGEVLNGTAGDVKEQMVELFVNTEYVGSCP